MQWKDTRNTCEPPPPPPPPPQKDYANARVEYQSALRLDPQNAILKDNLKKLENAAANMGVV